MSTHESVETANEAVSESGRWETVSVAPGTGGVVLPVPRELVARTVREGDDLVVVLADGRELVIEGFFAAGDVLLLARDGATGEVVALELSPAGEAAGVDPAARGRLEEMFGAADGADAFALATQEPSAEDGFGTAGIAAVAIGGLLVLAAIGGSDDGSDAAPTFPSGVGTPEDAAGAGVKGVTESNIGAFNEVLEAVRGQVRGMLSIDDAQMLADTVNEFGAAADGAAYAESESTVTFSIGAGAGARRVSVMLDGDLNPIQSREFVQDGSAAPSFRASRDVDDGDMPRMTEVDDTDDGTFAAERLEIHTYDAAGSRVGSRSLSLEQTRTKTTSGLEERLDIDSDGDGTVDRREVTTFSDADGDGTLGESDQRVSGESFSVDSQGAADGASTQITYQYDADGRLVRKQYDDDYDGTTFVADRVEVYSYDGDGEHVRTEFDDGDGTTAPDGTADRTEVYRYAYDDVDGTSRLVRMEADSDHDGTTFDVDRVEMYEYPAGGGERVAVFESDGTVLRHSYAEGDDGTGPLRAESLVDVDHDGTTFAPDRIHVYGTESDDGSGMVSTTVTPYSVAEVVTFGLDANGDRIAAVFDGDGTTAPDGTADRAEAYQLNEDGDRIAARFDDDFSDDGTYERAEFYTLDAAGGRTETRFDDDGDGTHERATFDANTDGTAEREERYTRDADGRRVVSTEIDDDPDGTFTADRAEEHSYYSDGGRSRTDFDDQYDGTFSATRYELYQYYGSGQLFRTAFDEDGVPSPADRVETYTYYGDGPAAGMLGRTDFDDDNNRATDRVEVYTYDAAGRLARTDFDDDYDGTDFEAERVEVREYDGDGRLGRLSFDEFEAGVGSVDDRDVDGTFDRSEAYLYDGLGRLAETRFDTDGDGDVDRAEFDADGNGTTDWVEHYRYDDQGRVAWTGFDRTDANVDGTADADGADGAVRESEAYTYGAGGLVTETRFDDNYSPVRSVVDRVERYVRDSDDRVTETWFDDDFDEAIGFLADRIEFDDDGDGTLDRTEARAYNNRNLVSEIASDADADGTDDVVESRTYDFLDRVLTRELRYDDGDDGTADRSETHTYEAGLGGGIMSTAYDDDLDGTADQIESYRYQGGERIEVWFDADADGTAERMESYGEDADGNEVVRYDDDASGGGTFERLELLVPDGEGRVVRVLYDDDASGDGTYERSVAYTHRDTGFDALFDENNDGTADASATYTVETGQPEARRPVYYDHDDSTVVYNDALDRVATGRVSTIAFDDDLTDDVPVERIETYTYDAQGRVEGVYVDSDAPADGTGDDERLVTLSYDGSGRVSRIAFDDDGVDGTNDLTVDISYNARGLAETLTYTAPLPVFGPTVISVERYTEFNERGDWLRRETDHLSDGTVDGSADVVEAREYADGSRFWSIQRSDGDVDGTMFTLSDGAWDEIEQRTYTGIRKNMEQRWRDWDADGNWDVVHTFRYAPGRADGAWERLRIDDDTDDDGTVNRVEYRYDNVDDLYGAYDDDQDGDIDGIRLFRDHTLEPDVARASEWAGLESVAMGPNGGAAVAGTLVITDAALSALAGGEADYSLQAMGEADDTLQISGDGIVRDASADTTDAGNDYEAYRGTDGVILVDSDITVYGAYDRDGDGAIDGIRLLADRTLEPDVARASGWAGLESVAMGPSGGTAVAGTLVITDAALSALAGGEAGYSLLVTGEADDTLQISGAGIARDMSADTTDAGNDYEAYRGTDGVILVDSDITVEMTSG